MQVSEEVAKERVLGRARGADDNEEVFYNRMRVYSEPLDEIRAFYKDKNVYCVVNGERSIDEIVADIKNLIENKLERK